ncbi:MAG: DUF2442 domain-containing protein [Phormidium sp.]
MIPPRINTAKVIEDYKLLVEFDNGEIRKYDVSKLSDNPMFALFNNPAFFRNFQVEPGGYALVWNEDIDISEYELWQHGTSVADEDSSSHLESLHFES